MGFDNALEGCLIELRREAGVLAVFLTGSVNRGEANEFSDLDISVLVQSLESVRSEVVYREGVLVSVERSTPEHRAKAFTDPETALWNLVSLQTGRALHDPQGVFAALQTQARGVKWSDLQGLADRQAAARLAGNAEELHKVMGGLLSADDAKVSYAVLGLTFGLGIAALLSRGRVLPTENSFLPLARDAWKDVIWRENYGLMVGLQDAPVQERGRAALRAYVRATELMSWAGSPERELAFGAAQRATVFLKQCF